MDHYESQKYSLALKVNQYYTNHSQDCCEMSAMDSSAPVDDMAQFMDIITTFKCKGCDYVCYKQEDLVEHVRHVHLPHTSSQEIPAQQGHHPTELPSGTTAETNTDEEADVETNSLIASLVDDTSVVPTIDNQSSYIPGTNLQQINIQTYVGGTPTDQVVLVDTGSTTTDLFPVADESSQLRELFVCDCCNVGFQSIDACKEHMVKDHGLNVSELSTSKAAIDLASLDQSGLPAASAGSQTAGDDETLDVIDPTTKPHNTSDSAAVTESTEKLEISGREELPGGKVSMSTQVIRKKVGRKTRAELAEIAAAAAREAATDLDTEEGEDNFGGGSSVTVQSFAGGAVIMEGDDEFDDPERIYVEIEIPGKRRRKIPSHLSKDYLMPKRTRRNSDPDYEPPPSQAPGLIDEMDDEERTAKFGKHYSVRASGKVRGPYKKKQSKPMEHKEPNPLKPYYPFKCRLCRAKFPTEESLTYHQTTHSDMKDDKDNPLFVCPEADCASEESKYQSPMWSDFKQHAWKEHKIDLGMVKCDECNYRATVPSKLVIHKQIHGQDRPYICDICQKGFKQAAQLKNHSLIHVAGTDLVEKESMSGRHWFAQSQCDICKRTFANQKSLQCHIEAVHDKVKPFACKFCGHTAARKAMMQLHMRTHTGEKPFKCDMCEYSTADHNSMRRHRMRHTGDKPYQCPHCPYACIQAVSLKLHLKSKHPSSSSCYSCNKCPYRSVNKNLFTNHMRDHEMGLIDESQLVPISEDNSMLQGGLPLKLGPINDLTNGTSNTTQLICSALNAIAPSLTEDGDPLPENIETTVHTISNDGGLKAHKITFHIPATATKNAKTAEVVVQEQTVLPDIDPLQVATMESAIPVTESLDMDEDTTENTELMKTIQQNNELAQGGSELQSDTVLQQAMQQTVTEYDHESIAEQHEADKTEEHSMLHSGEDIEQTLGDADD